MLVKKVKNRIILLIFAFVLSILIVFSIVKSLNENLLYFKTPTDLKEKVDKKTNQILVFLLQLGRRLLSKLQVHP